MAQIERPLSPFMTYRWTLTMVMSIVHRITGIGLYFGTLLLVWLIHHLLGGLRHLIWDLGYGFGPTEREWLTRAALIGSVSLKIVIWVIAYAAGGPR